MVSTPCAPISLAHVMPAPKSGIWKMVEEKWARGKWSQTKPAVRRWTICTKVEGEATWFWCGTVQIHSQTTVEVRQWPTRRGLIGPNEELMRQIFRSRDEFLRHIDSTVKNMKQRMFDLKHTESQWKEYRIENKGRKNIIIYLLRVITVWVRWGTLTAASTCESWSTESRNAVAHFDSRPKFFLNGHGTRHRNTNFQS